MLVSTNMDTLVFTPKHFYCFVRNNVGNMTVTGKGPIRQRVSMCHFVSYIIKFQKVVVNKIPPGGWRGRGGGGGGVGAGYSQHTV